MATRHEINQRFYSILDTAVGSNITPIKQGGEASSSVVYNDFPQNVRYNEGSKKPPKKVDRDSNGNITEEYYQSRYRLRYEIQVKATSDSDANAVYENIRQAFDRFDSLWLSASDFHSDCKDVDVNPGSTPDNSDVEDTLRVNFIAVEVEYENLTARFASQGTSATPITSIVTEMDLGDDGTVDDSYTSS